MLLRTSVFFLFSLLSLSTFAAPETETLIVYTYDSFVAKGGVGEVVRAAFKERTGAELKFIAPGDAGQAVAEIERESVQKKGLRGDVIVGIDQMTYGRLEAIALPLSDPMTNTGTNKPIEVRFPSAPMRPVSFLKNLPPKFWPVDYGYFAFIENKAHPKVGAPKTWADFVSPAFAKKLLLEDPRTSTPGLGFTLFAEAKLRGGEAPATFWKKVRGNALSVAPGWSQAYGLFLKSEAPYVWSYTTSEAYHVKDKEMAYRAIILKEGHPVQVEGAVLLKDTKLARAFLEVLQSEAVQTKIPETQWMYPVRAVPLPESFKNLEEPKEAVLLTTDQTEIRKALQTWKSAVSAF